MSGGTTKKGGIMMNNEVIKCPHCKKVFFLMENQTKCPFCDEDLNDFMKNFKDLFGKDNPFGNTEK